MKYSIGLISIILFLVAGLSFSVKAQQGFSIQKEPAWVEEISFNEKALPKDVEEAGGAYVLLLDKQHHVLQQALYRKYAVKLLNERGLQNEADLSLDYDPSYQQLILHSITVIRNGEQLNKLAPSDIKVIQREADAVQRIYDGRLTAVIHLKDVRVGDVLTYSYTLKGRNPMFKSLFFEDLYWQWGAPVDKINYRVLLPEERSLSIREKGEVPKATITTAGGQRIYQWQKEQMEALPYESQTPSWYSATPLIQLSEFEDWGQVVALFEADYKPQQGLSAEQWEAITKELFKPYDTEEVKITRLLQFVQNDIRYLGLENGISAYKPHTPGQVLEQKYGDCKDKALLLCALLYKLGIQAYPALVNTSRLGLVSEHLPNPGAFDHCIVRMEYQDSTYWFDATINSQGGTYRSVGLPHYQRALIMKAGETKLSPIADYPLDRREVKNYYLINKGDYSELTIMSRFRGYEAESQRSHFRNNSLREIERRYLNYYAGLYPGISLRESLKFRDRADEVETEEQYTIAGLWETSSQQAGLQAASFYPMYISDFLVVPDNKLRKNPFALNYPLQISEELLLELPERWNIKADRATISNEFFTFTYHVRYTHPVISIRYTYELHKNHVPANKVAAYIKDIERVKKQLGYELTYADDALVQTRLSYPMLVLMLIMLGAFIAAAGHIYKTYNPESLCYFNRYHSLGGWLYLPKAGLIISLISLVATIFSWNYFDAIRLHRLFDTTSDYYNPLLGTITVIELIFNGACLVMAILLLVLMHKRRSSFPALMILYLAANLGFLILELIVLEQSQVMDSALLESYYTSLTFSIIGCMIWIPYFKMSKRVKRTFTVQLEEEDPEEVEEQRFQENNY